MPNPHYEAKCRSASARSSNGYRSTLFILLGHFRNPWDYSYERPRIARRIRLRSAGWFRTVSSCCQTRRIFHPASFNVWFTSRSRSRLRVSLFVQKAVFEDGQSPCCGQQCQKHPSTNTAIRSFRKTKSGFPNTPEFRRHPVILCSRNSVTIATSVARFPLACT
jgi:hypothetical protein